MKTIHITEQTNNTLENLKKRLKKDKQTIANEAIIYISKFMIDPSDLEAGDARPAIKTLDNRIVGFLKNQEKTILNRYLPDIMELAQKAVQGISRLIEKYQQQSEKVTEIWKGIGYLIQEQKKQQDKALQMKERILAFIASNKHEIGRVNPSADVDKLMKRINDEL